MGRVHPQLQPGLRGPRVAGRTPEGKELCFWQGQSRSLLRPWVLPGFRWRCWVHSRLPEAPGPGQEGLSLPSPQCRCVGTPAWPPCRSLSPGLPRGRGLGAPRGPLAVVVLQEDGEELPAPPGSPPGNGALGHGEETFSNLPRFQFLPVPVRLLQLQFVWLRRGLSRLPPCPGVSPRPGRAPAQPHKLQDRKSVV